MKKINHIPSFDTIIMKSSKKDEKVEKKQEDIKIEDAKSANTKIREAIQKANSEESKKSSPSKDNSLSNGPIIPIFTPTNSDGSPVVESKEATQIFEASSDTSHADDKHIPTSAPTVEEKITVQESAQPKVIPDSLPDINIEVSGEQNNKLAIVGKKIESIISRFHGYKTVFREDSVGLYHGQITDENGNIIAGYTFDIGGLILNKTSKWFPVELPEKGKGYEDYPVYDISSEDAWMAFIKKEPMDKIRLLDGPQYLGINRYVDLVSLQSFNIDTKLRNTIMGKLRSAYQQKRFADPEFKTRNRYRIIKVMNDGSFIMRNDAPRRFAFPVVSENISDVTVQ